MKLRVVFLCAAFSGGVLAQTSPSYRGSEYVFNEGGHPEAGVVLHSTSFRMSLDSVGDGLVAPTLQSASYAMDAGFARSYPPPREVQGLLVLSDKATFSWNPEPATGAYDLYRGFVGDLPDGYGVCRVSDVPGTSTLLSELPEADPGQGFFYIVTAKNRLREEGVKGYASSGSLRANPQPCP